MRSEHYILELEQRIIRLITERDEAINERDVANKRVQELEKKLGSFIELSAKQSAVSTLEGNLNEINLAK